MLERFIPKYKSLVASGFPFKLTINAMRMAPALMHIPMKIIQDIIFINFNIALVFIIFTSKIKANIKIIY